MAFATTPRLERRVVCPKCDEAIASSATAVRASSPSARCAAKPSTPAVAANTRAATAADRDTQAGHAGRHRGDRHRRERAGERRGGLFCCHHTDATGPALREVGFDRRRRVRGPVKPSAYNSASSSKWFHRGSFRRGSTCSSSQREPTNLLFDRPQRHVALDRDLGERSIGRIRTQVTSRCRGGPTSSARADALRLDGIDRRPSGPTGSTSCGSTRRALPPVLPPLRRAAMSSASRPGAGDPEDGSSAPRLGLVFPAHPRRAGGPVDRSSAAARPEHGVGYRPQARRVARSA